MRRHNRPAGIEYTEYAKVLVNGLSQKKHAQLFYRITKKSPVSTRFV